MRAIRNALQSATVRLASENEEIKRTEDVVTKSARVQKALDAYCGKLAEFNGASRFLFAELSDFYPELGPLSNPLKQLGAPEDSSPWSDASASTRSEAMKLNIAMPSAGIGNIAHGITEDIKARDTLAQEVQHYTDKVGRLQQDFNGAKPKDREEAKLKLDENKDKLSKAMASHSEKLHKVQASLNSLDSDIVAVLTPTLLQLLKTQMGWYTDCVNYYNSALEGVSTQAVGRRPSASTASVPTPSPMGAMMAPMAMENSMPATSSRPTEVFAPVSMAPQATASIEVMQAVASMESATEGDLSFEKGDLILVLNKNDDGWWEARRGDEVGVAPMNYLAEWKQTYVGTAVAKFAFTSDDPGEINLKAGDSVDVIFPHFPPADNEAWTLIRFNGRVGYVPTAYLQAPQPAAIKPSIAAPLAKVAPASSSGTSTDTAAPAAEKPFMSKKASPGPVPTMAHTKPSPTITSTPSTAGPLPTSVVAQAVAKRSSPLPNPVPAVTAVATTSTSEHAVVIPPQLPTAAALSNSLTKLTPAATESKPAQMPVKAPLAAEAPAPKPAAVPLPVKAPMAAEPPAPKPAAVPLPVKAPVAVEAKPSSKATPSQSSSVPTEAPPPDSRFWTDPAYSVYARLLKMGMPVDNVSLKMQAEGADMSVFGPSAGASGAVQPAVTKTAVVTETKPPVTTTQSTTESKPTAGSKSVFNKFGFGSSKPQESVPAPKATAPPSVPARKASTGGDSSAPAKPTALLSGIQGFNKTKLKHADTVEKGGLTPTTTVAAPAHRASMPPPTSSGGKESAPARAAPTSGLSMMEEMKLRAARRASQS